MSDDKKDVIREVVVRVCELIKNDDRGQMARIKRCVNMDYDFSVMPETFGWMYDTWAGSVIDLCVPYMVYHKIQDEGRGFADAWNEYRRRCGVSNEEPINKKFNRLLKCDSKEEFKSEFGGMVRRLKQEKIGFDWYWFMKDVSYWMSGKDEDKKVVKRWVKDYYCK